MSLLPRDTGQSERENIETYILMKFTPASKCQEGPPGWRENMWQLGEVLWATLGSTRGLKDGWSLVMDTLGSQHFMKKEH